MLPSKVVDSVRNWCSSKSTKLLTFSQTVENFLIKQIGLKDLDTFSFFPNTILKHQKFLIWLIKRLNKMISGTICTKY